MLPGFVWGGFEGASHRRRAGQVRVDAIAASGHDRFAALEYAILRSLGIRTAREALRWHLIQPSRGRFDFSSARAQLDAARQHGAAVVLDLCHWGVPDWLDTMGDEFPNALAELARRTAEHVAAEGYPVAAWVPVNEISFWAWAGGQKGGFGPFLVGRGDALKKQLVRGHVAAAQALRSAGTTAPIMVCEPLINVMPRSASPRAASMASAYVDASFEAVRWILEADPTAIDVLGLNHYPHNQWWLGGRKIPATHRDYRRLRMLLQGAFRRFGLPIAIAETGAEEPLGDAWMAYVRDECDAAIETGVPLIGACIFPVMDYAGWDNGRHCPCGPIGHRPGDLGGERFVRPGQAAAIRALGRLAPATRLRALV